MKQRVTITGARAREILDSRGNPTLQAEVILSDGTVGSAAVPSGASVGTHEAWELRDNDPARFKGKGVLQAVANVNGPISKALEGLTPWDQEEIDRTLIALDGTPDKRRLGANAILGASLAAARAACCSLGQPIYHYLAPEQRYSLPVPMLNILNGGKHARDSTDFQEFMIVPAGANSFAEAMRMACEIYQTLKQNLQECGESTCVGDEGGFAPRGFTNHRAIESVLEAIEDAGYTPGSDCLLALDAAASEFYHEGIYYLRREGLTLSTHEMVGYYEKLVSTYPIVSIEDGLAEDDWDGWQRLVMRLGDRVQLVGDDLYVTNSSRIEKGISLKATNSVLIKPNQIGTLTEVVDAIHMAHRARWSTVISHRSGETEDSIIADLAVGLGTGFIKAGAPCRSERTAKYNRLLIIEEALGKKVSFVGLSGFPMSLK